jgi:HK97 family phage major capsid protein
MNKEQYLAQRKVLLDAAETLLNEGKITDSQAKQEEIKTLDIQFENIAKEQANLRALAGTGVTNNTGIQNGVIATFASSTNQSTPEDKYSTTEYRIAFANFIANGKSIPAKFSNVDESTTTGDVSSVIPTTIIPRLVETLEKIGMIYPLVTQTNYKTGINIPTSTVKPVATRVAEGASSDRQKKTTSYISFSKFKLRCEISWSMEVNEMTLPLFESAFVRQVSEAMIKKVEGEIISTNDGTTGCRGILAETPNTGQALTAKTLTYEKLVEIEAAIPEEYEGGAVWCMSKKTFMGFISMTDADGQPIARINYGIGGKPERTLLGRTVVTAGSYMPSFSSGLAAGTIFAFIFNFSDYVHNTVYDMGIQRKQDWDTEDMLTKAVMSDDGKVVDKGSLVTVTKSA